MTLKLAMLATVIVVPPVPTENSTLPLLLRML